MKQASSTPQKKQDTTHFPRLVTEMIGTKAVKEVGYVELHNPVRRLEIGPTETKEFFLVKCMFSPQGSLFSPYNSVRQSLERVYNAMHTTKNDLMRDPTAAANEMMISVVQKAIDALRRKEAGKYLIFTIQDDSIQMELHPSIWQNPVA
ncbi:MAG: hypothetical protein JWO43_588 [Candidatus Adlerbacteria bacterium]|nr:hypothetical protein [Candidatus Adlerbacteria bacterium]